MLSFMPSLDVDEELARRALNGMHFRLPINDEIVVLKSGGEAIAIYERLPSGVYSPKRGLR